MKIFFCHPRKKTIREDARDRLLQMSNEIRDPHRRSEEILKILDPIFRKIVQKNVLADEVIEEMRLRIEQYADIKDVTSFVDRIMSELDPVFSLLKETQEEIQTDVMNEQGGFIPLNRLLSYGVSRPEVHIYTSSSESVRGESGTHGTSGSEIHIHASFGESVEGKLALYRSGMRKLATIVNDDPKIKEITATSWIVAAHPDIFTKWGFDVKNISSMYHKSSFGHDRRKVQRATISREKFLKKFLKNN